MSPAVTPSRHSRARFRGVSGLQVLRRRWLVLVIAVLIGTAVALIFTERQASQFQASGRVFLHTSGGGDAPNPALVVGTQARFAASTPVLDLIAAQLKVPRGYVWERMKVTAADDGYYFTVVGREATQERAARLVRLAQAAYQQLLAQQGPGGQGVVERMTKLRNELTQARQGLQARKAALPPRTDDPALEKQIDDLDAQISDLDRRLAQAQVDVALGGGPVLLVEAPRSNGRIAPRPFLNVLVGSLGGLILTAAVVWSAYLRRPTVTTAHAAADALRTPLLASVPGGRRSELPTDKLVAAMSSVLAPGVKIVALTPAGRGDLGADLVATAAGSWSDDLGVVLVLDASGEPNVRMVLERLPRAVSGELPRWAHDPTCMARSSGTGRGHLLYNRVAPARATRPGGLEPILADRAPVVGLVVVLTPALSDLPMAAASTLQAHAVVVVASGRTQLRDLLRIPWQWPALSERIAGVVYDGRPAFRRSVAVEGFDRGTQPADAAAHHRPAAAGALSSATAMRAPVPSLDVDSETTDRYARPGMGR